MMDADNKTQPRPGIRVFSCQGIMPNGRRCGRFSQWQEEDGIWLCKYCHAKRYKRAIGKKVKFMINADFMKLERKPKEDFPIKKIWKVV